MLFHVVVINVIDSPFQLFNTFVLLKEEDQKYDKHVMCWTLILKFNIWWYR